MMTKAKTYVALLIGAIGEAVTLGIIPDRWQPVAQGVVALATALGVYVVPNRPEEKETS